MTDKSNLERYSKDLDKAGRQNLSRAELAELHKQAVQGDRESWEALWLHGTRLVLKIVNHMADAGVLRMEKQDAIAEGNLAIGKALLSWKPRKGGFGTWVWIEIRGAIWKENDKHERSFLTGMVENTEVLSDNEYGDFSLTEYSNEGQTPEDAMRTAEYAELLQAIEQLPPREQEYIVRHFLCDESQEDIAVSEGVSSAMIRKVIARGFERIKEKVSL